jgi:MoaA/NifB/PqqE/SkfB family radical SAM enzyme
MVQLKTLMQLRKVVTVLATRGLSFDVDLIPCRFRGLPARKVLNWLLTESSVYFKPAKPWGFPTIMQVEVSSRCNLSCPMCPVSIGLDRPAGLMDLGLFQKVIDELGDHLFVLLFWDWGEPFLNPHAYQMIRYAQSRDIRVISSTNGHLFATGHHATHVVESGLDALVFSVDGITQETYQQYRAGGRLDQVLEGIARVVAAKRRMASRTPLINLRFIVMEHNEQEVRHLKGFASALGVDLLSIRKYHMSHSGGLDHDKALKLSPKQSKYQLPPLDPATRKPIRAAQNPCRNLWNCATIHWDGTVCSCFMDFAGKRPLGSLRSQSFGEIWHGHDYLRLRAQFRERWQELTPCGHCSNGFLGGDVGQDSNAEAIWVSTPMDKAP